MKKLFKLVLQIVMYFLVINLFHLHFHFAKCIYVSLYDNDLHVNDNKDIQQHSTLQNALVGFLNKFTFGLCGEVCYKSILAVGLSGCFAFNVKNIKIGIL
jgi:hypothetical protein